MRRIAIFILAAALSVTPVADAKHRRHHHRTYHGGCMDPKTGGAYYDPYAGQDPKTGGSVPCHKPGT